MPSIKRNRFTEFGVQMCHTQKEEEEDMPFT